MHRTLFSNAEWIIIMINKIVHCYLELNIYRIANSRILCSFLSSIKFGSMNPLYTHFQLGGETASRFRPKSFACGGLFPFENAETIQNNSIFVFVSFYWHFFCTKIPFLIDHCRANESISFIISTIIFFFKREKHFSYNLVVTAKSNVDFYCYPLLLKQRTFWSYVYFDCILHFNRIYSFCLSLLIDCKSFMCIQFVFFFLLFVF